MSKKKTVATQGGEARAKALSPSRRADIAREAAAARWGIQKASYEGVLKLGEMEIPCAVLQDGTRLLSQRAFSSALGAPRGGTAYATRESGGGAGLPVFIALDKLKPFISLELAAALSSPFEYIPQHGGRSALGVKAELVPQVCDVWLKAREAGVKLTKQQLRVAHQAELLMRGLAHVGIIALVDEATGYQDDRDRQALSRILESFVAKELKKWVSTFPADFYKEMFRLWGWKFPTLPKEQQRRPVMVGKITNDIVYARLAPGVRQELHRLTPRDEKGRLKHKLFQRLTGDWGHPKLREHLAAVTVLMKTCDTWAEFMVRLEKALPKYKDLPLLELMEASDNRPAN